MADKILIKYSDTPGAIPSPGNLDHRELAINIADKILFIKDSSGDIAKFTHIDDTVISPISHWSSYKEKHELDLVVGWADFAENTSHGSTNDNTEWLPTDISVIARPEYDEPIELMTNQLFRIKRNTTNTSNAIILDAKWQRSIDSGSWQNIGPVFYILGIKEKAGWGSNFKGNYIESTYPVYGVDTDPVIGSENEYRLVIKPKYNGDIAYFKTIKDLSMMSARYRRWT